MLVGKKKKMLVWTIISAPSVTDPDPNANADSSPTTAHAHSLTYQRCPPKILTRRGHS